MLKIIEMKNLEESKSQVSNLIKKYYCLLESGKIKSYNEAQTVNEFILPLFSFLGWDIHNINADEITPEERISKGRVDWAFRIDGIPKFFLEAKAMKVDLDVGKWAEQAINYAWNKGCTWAILTDFEGIKVFNADVSSKNTRESLFFELKVGEYLERFDQLWLLSKETFKQGLLDKEAEKWGKKVKRTPVGEKLFQDMMEWRNLLTKEFHRRNKLEHEELDEGVQRILDRLVFIRVTEDRGIEPNTLLSALRTMQEGKSLARSLSKIFRDFDKGYNSKLFSPHASEDWRIDNEPLETVINGIYETKDGYRYDFSVISADVLGGIYEQYLGHILRQAKKRASVKKEQQKRKEQGIYYTPQFVVKYIVKNTLGKLLQELPLNKAMNIKILDPACGSGSFLVEALDVMDNYLAAKRNQKKAQIGFDFFRKVEILKKNICGVDLDAQAVEICQLNLLLRTLKQRAILPNLTENIKCGNSLISGNPLELIKYFDKPEEKRPIKWEDEFKDVMSGGGFDVIIGNPPYVRSRNLNEGERRYFADHFESAFRTFDIYLFFLEKSLQLLKDKGIMGFIIPYPFLNQPYATKLRKLLLEKSSILEIVDLSSSKVFRDAEVKSCIIFCQKNDKPSKVYITRLVDDSLKVVDKIEQKSFLSNPDYMFKIEFTEHTKDIISKIEKGSIPFSKIVYISKGIEVYERDSGRTKNDFIMDIPKAKNHKPYLEAKEISCYQIDWRRRYISYEPERHCSGKFPELFENEKILMKRIIGDRGLSCYLDTDNFYVENTLICCLLKKDLQKKFDFDKEEIEISKKYSLPFLLAILNSKLMTYYFKVKLGDNLQIYNRAVEQLPIKLLNLSNPSEKSIHDELASLAGKMLNLHKELQKTSENTDKWYALKKEIEKTDKAIDERVYEVYGIGEKEVRIIEKNKTI